MIESVEIYNSFLKEIENHGIIIHVIPVDPYVHSVKRIPSSVLIKDVNTKKTYIISFSHPDVKQVVTLEKVNQDINLQTGSKWAFDKKSTMQSFPVDNVNDINLLTFLGKNLIIEEEVYHTTAHKFIRSIGETKINNCIPILKHQETFEKMCDVFFETIPYCIRDEGYIKENSIIIETLSEIEKNGIYVNENCFRRFHEKADIYENNLVYSQYNIYTSTGRPSNRFQSVNYAALNKENGVRSCFTSRFKKDGKMILIDYSAFHPRIICHLTQFDLPSNIDIYRYLGELYFKREELSDFDIDESKKLTFK